MNSVVYFIQAPAGRIKIGTTTDIDRRLNDIRKVAPEAQLLCAVPGAYSVEKYFHGRLSAHRIGGGEWFEPADPVLAAVASIKERGLAALPEELRVESAEADRRLARRLVAREMMAVYLRHCAAPAIEGEPVPDAIARAAKRLGISLSRVTSYWYGNANEVRHDEAEAIRECAIRFTEDVVFLRRELKRLTDTMAVVGEAVERLTAPASVEAA